MGRQQPSPPARPLRRGPAGDAGSATDRLAARRLLPQPRPTRQPPAPPAAPPLPVRPAPEDAATGGARLLPAPKPAPAKGEPLPRRPLSRPRGPVLVPPLRDTDPAAGADPTT
jgi:hypothetical protein